jgi:hypothetical protein
LDYEQFIELKIGMKEKNPPSQRTDFALDSFSELGIFLPREPFRVELEFLAIRLYRFFRNGFRDIIASAARKRERVVGGIGENRRRLDRQKTAAILENPFLKDIVNSFL